MARRMVHVMAALETAAVKVLRSDSDAIEAARKDEHMNCFQLPLLAGQFGVKTPVRSKQMLAGALAYSFQRPAGTVRTWHVFVDRFSIVFSRLLAKLVYQLKAMTASLDFAFLVGAGSLLFWGEESVLTGSGAWLWPNHGSECRESSDLDVSTLSIIISNKTPAEVVEAVWTAATKLLEASENLHILFIEDPLREASETIYRPVYAAEITLRCRQVMKNLRKSRNLSIAMIWRRHQSTLTRREVTALNLPCMSHETREVREVKVLTVDVRDPSNAMNLEGVMQMIQGLQRADSIARMTGWAIYKTQAKTAKAQNFQKTWWSLEAYLDFHQRGVQAFASGASRGPQETSQQSNLDAKQFRALIYVCNPFTLCGGHGDRTNGIISAFLLAILTSRVFFIDFDSPLPLSMVLQPRLEDGKFLLDWRLKNLGAMSASQSFYLDDRISFQEDLTWLVEDSSQVLQLSMNHREISAILVPS